MRIAALMLLMVLAPEIYGQALTWEAEGLENNFYYPSKKAIRDNNVKFVIDSNVYQQPRGYWVEAFDKKGRIIGSFSYSVDSFANPYVYIEKGDTLVRHRLRDKDSTVYMLERFVYDKSGKIIQFDRFHNVFSEGGLDLSRTVFFYENDHVCDKLGYHLKKRGPLVEDFDVATDSLHLQSAKHYTYYKAKLRSLVVINENFGIPELRDVDTFIYDRRQRLIRHSNYAKSAYLFCSYRSNNVNRVEQFEYKNDSVFIHAYTTTEQGLRDEEYKIRVYSKSGLEIKNFHGSTKYKIELYDRLKYIPY